MSTTLPNLGLKTDFTVGEDGWGDDINANFKSIDGLCSIRLVNIVTSLPGSANAGEAFILTPANSVNIWNGTGWDTYAAKAGMFATKFGTSELYSFNGTTWINVNAQILASVPAIPTIVEDLTDVNIDDRNDDTTMVYQAGEYVHVPYFYVGDVSSINRDMLSTGAVAKLNVGNTSSATVTTDINTDLINFEAACTVTLHDPSTVTGQKIILTKKFAGAGLIVINGTINETSSTSIVLSENYESVTLVADSFSWQVINTRFKAIKSVDLNTFINASANDVWDGVGTPGGGGNYDRDLELCKGVWRVTIQPSYLLSSGSHTGNVYTNFSLFKMVANNSTTGTMVGGSMTASIHNISPTIIAGGTVDKTFIVTNTDSGLSYYRLHMRRSVAATTFEVTETLTGSLTNPDSESFMIAERIGV